MKVNVFQVEDVKFRKFAWWSNWVDVCVFNHDLEGMLLQMSISRTNSKKFKCVKFKSSLGIAYCTIGNAGDLTQMGKSND